MHGSVIHNHVIDFEGGIIFSNLLDGVSEQTVSQFHDVGLVDCGDLLPVVGDGEGTGKSGDSLGLCPGDDLQGLDDPADRLVFQARVFTFSVLSNDAQIDVVVAGFQAGNILDEDNGGIGVKLLSHSYVEGLVTRAFHWSVQDTFEANLVSPQRGYGLVEEVLGVLVAGLDTSDVYLLPLDRNIVSFEDGLDRLSDLGTNTIT